MSAPTPLVLSCDATPANEGKRLMARGWAQTRRDHGGVIFIDLRDSAGVLQVVASPDNADVFAAAEATRAECVLRVVGVLRRRPPETENPALASGHMELAAAELEILNAAAALPFLPDDDSAGEEVRLRHRVLELRGARMRANLRLRHTVAAAFRERLNAAGFCEVETPLLTRATPEGARDFLCPSRLQPGDFYALPQSPQLFKQLLMAAGVEKYYQIARCFRDEDLRADRQPEFSQVDIEMAFVDEEEVMQTAETLMRDVFAAAGEALPDPFPRMAWDEAMRRFGTDRPDLRNPLELTELTQDMRETEFAVFRAAANAANGRVAALRLPAGADLSRKEIDDLTAFVSNHGAKGLAYIKLQEATDGGLEMQSPIAKFLSESARAAILQKTAAAAGDIVFFGAGKADAVNASLAALRGKLAANRGLLQTAQKWAPLWVADFPMFEQTDAGLQARHHPFTAPRLPAGEAPTANCLSRAYDMVINGAEVGGGSIRNHRAEAQLQVLAALGVSRQEAEDKFGFLLAALKSGAPPHGGIAFGLDRIVAMLCGAASIREVIAFPKTQRGQCLLTGAPAAVEDSQLQELGLRLRPGKSAAPA